MTDPGAIQRVLLVAPRVHVYQIPPLTSATSGPAAAGWTSQPPIFSGRLRVLETASRSGGISVAVLLEDASSGELFAGAPYTSPATVQGCIDSARFFAVRVVGGEGGKMKATLGVGFEERSEAFDFGIALQEAAKVLGFGAADSTAQKGRGAARKKDDAGETKKDYSLKEGETITVNIGSRGGRQKAKPDHEDPSVRNGEGGVFPFLPPPPSASELKESLSTDRRRSQQSIEGKTAEQLGFDDGEFGEFQ